MDVPVESAWKSLGGDFRRTGLSKHAGPEIGCTKWTFETDGAVSASISVGAAGRIHIPCEDGRLYTLDPNGSLLWSYNANTPLISSPSVGPDGTVYVGGMNGKLHAIDLSGSLLWAYHTGGFMYSSPAVSESGNIYFGSQDGMFNALAQDGTELWSFQAKGPGLVPRGSIFASPAIGTDGTVYVGGLYDPNLYALDPNDGSLKWTCNFEFPIYPGHPEGPTEFGWPFASPTVAPDGMIYQTLLYDSNLYAIEPGGGAIIWSTDLADPKTGWFNPNYAEEHGDADGWSEPALGPDGTIYVSFDDPYLRAVNRNGSIKWVTRLGDVGGFTLAVGNNGLIYAAGDDGFLYVVDADGWEVSRFASGVWLNSPAIAAEEVVIVADGKDDSLLITDVNNRVWAFGSHDCSWPTFELHLIQDLDADGNVTFSDFALMAADWLGCTDPDWPCNYVGENMYLPGDIDRDRRVYFSDLKALAYRWLSDTGAPRGPRLPAPSPELPTPPLPTPPLPKPPLPKGRSCFLADTLVWIDGGLVRISDVVSGQIAGKLDRNPETPCLGQIAGIEEHEGIFERYDVLLETGDCISIVDSHYFLNESGQWVDVRNLLAGSILQSLEGPLRIARVTRRQESFAGKSYNLKIEGTDRYFVGRLGVIVRDW
jgi:outer membrane protein assembly factor BamB